MKPLAFVAVALSTSLTMSAATPNLWLHVRAVERNGSGAKVKINLPLSLVQALAPMIEEHSGQRVRLRINEDELTERDVHALADAFRTGPDGPLVNVWKRGGETTTVEKRGGNLLIRNVEPDGALTVVTINGGVINALASRTDGALDIAAAVRALASSGTGDLVFVNDGEDTVHIWIDHSPEGAER